MNPNNKYIPKPNIPPKPRFNDKPILKFNIDESLTDQVFSFVGSGDISSLEKFFLGNNIPLTVTNANGETVLHVALNSNLREDDTLRLITMLVDKGAPINKKNTYEVTPLHLAVKKMFPSVVKYLVEKGAHPDAVDNQLLTPIHYASMGYFKECLPEKEVEDIIPPPNVDKKDMEPIKNDILKAIIGAINDKTNPNIRESIERLGKVIDAYDTFRKDSFQFPNDTKLYNERFNTIQNIVETHYGNETAIKENLNAHADVLENEILQHLQNSKPIDIDVDVDNYAKTMLTELNNQKTIITENFRTINNKLNTVYTKLENLKKLLIEFPDHIKNFNFDNLSSFANVSCMIYDNADILQSGGGINKIEFVPYLKLPLLLKKLSKLFKPSDPTYRQYLKDINVYLDRNDTKKLDALAKQFNVNDVSKNTLGGALTNKNIDVNFLRHINVHNEYLIKNLTIIDLSQPGHKENYEALLSSSIIINIIFNSFLFIAKQLAPCVEFKALEYELNNIKSRYDAYSDPTFDLVYNDLMRWIRYLQNTFSACVSEIADLIKQYNTLAFQYVDVLNKINSLYLEDKPKDNNFVGIYPFISLPDINKFTTTLNTPDFYEYTIPTIKSYIGNVSTTAPNTIPGKHTLNIDNFKLSTNEYIFGNALQTKLKTPDYTGIIKNTSVKIPRAFNSLKLYYPETVAIAKAKVIRSLFNLIKTGLEGKIKALIDIKDNRVKDKIANNILYQAIQSALDRQIQYFAMKTARNIINEEVSEHFKTYKINLVGLDVSNKVNDYLNFSGINELVYNEIIKAYNKQLKGFLPIMKPEHIPLITQNKKDDKEYIFYDTNYFQPISKTVECYHPHSVDVLDKLKGKNVSLNIQDINGHTPLYYAIQAYNVPVIENILKGATRYNDPKYKDMVKDKQRKHMEYLLDASNRLVFTRKYWELLKTELEENALIRNNIPMYLDDIFDVAVYIQNFYWYNLDNGDFKLKELVTENDISSIVEELLNKAKQYKTMMQFAKEDFSNGTDRWNNKIKYNIKALGTAIGKLRGLNAPATVTITTPTVTPLVTSATINSKIYDYTDAVLVELTRIATTLNDKYHSGYALFWNHLCQQEIDKQNYLVHLNKCINWKDNKSVNIDKYVQFIEFQYFKDKSLETNVYYGFIVRLYTHIMGMILGSNMYHAIEKLVINHIMSKMDEGGNANNIIDDVRKHLESIKEYVHNDAQSSKNMNYLYVLKSLEYDKYLEKDIATPDVLFDNVTPMLATISDDVKQQYETNLIPYYKTLYSIVFKYLDMMLRNYHKFILNQKRGLEVYNLL